MDKPNDSPAPSSLSNDELLAAYEQTSGSPESTAANVLLAEIQRRGLDV